MATRPYKKGTKRMIEQIKTELEEELLKLDKVKSVSWEYPAYLSIQTTWGDFAMGEVNGPIGWNDFDGYVDGETTETTPAEIAKAFHDWLIATNEGVSE
jgi:hypothetical protein